MDDEPHRWLQHDGVGLRAVDLHDGDIYAIDAPGYQTTYVRIRRGGLDLVDDHLDLFAMHRIFSFPFRSTRDVYTVAATFDCAQGASVRIPMSRNASILDLPIVAPPWPAILPLLIP